jgi:hypothetical protein
VDPNAEPILASYVLANVTPFAGRHELAPGVVAVGMPDGLGYLGTVGTPIRLLYKKTRSDDQSAMIRFGLSHGGRVAGEILVAPEVNAAFAGRAETALALKMALQCAGLGNAEVPVGLSVPLTELASAEDTSVELADIDLHKGSMRFPFQNGDPLAAFEELRKNWPTFLNFFIGSERERFRLALQAVEASRYAYNVRFALALLWVAPEAIFSASTSEVTYKITAAWATVAAPAGKERRELQRALQKLYTLRSRAVHGDPKASIPDLAKAYHETYIRLMQCLGLLLERTGFPTAQELLGAVLGEAEPDEAAPPDDHLDDG